MTTRLTIKGMHCGSCKMLIEDVCKDIAGVTSCVVDVQEESAVIEHDSSVDSRKIIAEISSLGDYKVTIKE